MKKFLPIISLASRLTALSRDFITQEIRNAGHPEIEPCHGDVFVALFSEDGLGLVELARRCNKSKSNVSVMVRRLTALGYLEKIDNDEDIRAVKICLTKKGLGLKPIFEEISEKLQKIVGAGFSSSELTTFEASLRQSIANFETTLKGK